MTPATDQVTERLGGRLSELTANYPLPIQCDGFVVGNGVSEIRIHLFSELHTAS